MKLWLNGKICDEQEAVISVFDHGFLYGMGLFETFRTYNRAPFLLKEHMDRLVEGCRELGINPAAIPPASSLSDQIRELLAENHLNDAYVRFSVSAGNGPIGLQTEIYSKPNMVLYMKELPIFDSLLYSQGKALQRLCLRRNSPEGVVRRKSFHYMNNMLAKQELVSYPWATGAEGLMFSDREQIAEGIVSNVFFMRAGVCCTPALDIGILPGITRGCVLKLAGEAGLQVLEGHFSWEELLDAEEVFVTNSIQEIVPISRLYDKDGQMYTVGSGRAGQWTTLLLQSYRSLTRIGQVGHSY